MIAAIGWLGSLLLAACGLPLLFPNRRAGTDVFLFLWLVGECLLFVYEMGTTQRAPLLVNYGFNTLLVLVVMRRGHAR